MEQKIGAGGMGEVYRAIDTRLGREVALKVLPAEVARDEHRLSRLGHEARLLASLNHPNVAAIYGLEEVDGIRFLVLELVGGETLAQRIGRGRVPVAESLEIVRGIAEGLEAAHEKRIIHRDLKPGNVMVTPEGTVKILDFGLAKGFAPTAPSEILTEEPTRTVLSREQVVLGTMPYMSPEQARGGSVDRRSDIWSFGCMLFEMLTGRRPFEGETPSDCMAAILQREPDWGSLPAAVPPRVRELLQRCLRKDPVRRLRDAGDARLEIEEAIIEGTSAGAMATPRERGRRLWVTLTAGLVIAALLGFGTARWIWRIGTAPTASWSGDLLLGGSMFVSAPRPSPDGRLLAFLLLKNGLSQVAIMEPGTAHWSDLTHDREHGPVLSLAWSPDGSRIYYDRGTSRVLSVSAVGGEERLVLEGAGQPETLPDGSLLVMRVSEGRFTRIHRFWPDTARIDPVGPRFIAAWPFNQWPHASPDGKVAVFFGQPAESDAAGSDFGPYVIDLASGRIRRLAPTLKFRVPTTPFMPALTISHDGRSAIMDVPSGDLHQITAVPLAGEGLPVPLFALTSFPSALNVGPDGSLYLDQFNIGVHVLRFTETGGPPERIARSTGAFTGTGPLELPDGRVLFSSVASGRTRLLAALRGQEAVPFVQTDEDTSGPTALIGNDSVAFFMGSPPDIAIAIASADGRIQRRLGAHFTEFPGSLAASPDGRTLFYAESGFVWAIEIAGGDARKLHVGDAVTVTPDGKSLIVQLMVGEASRLLLLPISGGEPVEIPVLGKNYLAPNPIAGRSVRADGRIALPLQAPDSWFWRPGVLNRHTGAVLRVPLEFDGDVIKMNWAGDGSLLALGWEYKTDLWRFRPAVPRTDF